MKFLFKILILMLTTVRKFVLISEHVKHCAKYCKVFDINRTVATHG